MQFRNYVEKFTKALAIAVVVIVIGLFIFMVAGCSSSGRVVNSEAFLKSEAAFFSALEREENNCIVNKGEWTEYGCYFEDEECKTIDPQIKHKMDTTIEYSY